MCIEKQDVDLLVARMVELEKDNESIQAQLRQLSCDTKDMVEFFRAMKGAFKVLDWIAKLAKPVAMIGAAFLAATAFWTWVKAGMPPPGEH